MAKRGRVVRPVGTGTEEYQIASGGVTAQYLVPLDSQKSWMRRQGLVHGDGDGVRFATLRADGKAPPLNAGIDYTLQTRSAGEPRQTGTASGKIAQPRRRS